MAMAWYVVHTYSGYENKAKLALEDAIRRYAVEDKFGEILVPPRRSLRSRTAKRRQTLARSFLATSSFKWRSTQRPGTW
jgi:transcriptional antiterminator NusG